MSTTSARASRPRGKIAAGETVTGQIGTPSDQDWLKIDLQQGQLYTFTLLGEPDGGGTLPDSGAGPL